MAWELDQDLPAVDTFNDPLPLLDNEERSRLRDILGPATVDSAELRSSSVLDLREEADVAPPLTVEDRLVNLSFVLGDLDRKIEKLADTTVLIEQLGDQVRRLSERINRIEQLLVGRSKITRF